MGEIIMKKGFTLIELLVVMALFLTLMLVVSDIFLSVSLVQRKTLAYQQAANDLQFNLEQIVQFIRLNKIDYDYYGGQLTGPVETLALRDRDNQKISISRTMVHCSTDVSACLSRTAGDQTTIISANNVNIEKLAFVISPKQTPYVITGQKYLSQEQPMVMVVLMGKTLAPLAADQKTIFLQTAVSSRYYVR